MMMDKLSIQKNYADQIGGYLDLFKVQVYSPYKANFRCPICGDSSRNKFKRRAYIIEKDSSLLFYCHNGCGSMSFENFMRRYHGTEYNHYKFDIIKEMRGQKFSYNKNVNNNIKTQEENKPKHEWPFIKLNTSDPEYGYISNRKIEFDDIWLSHDFNKDINSIIPNKLNSNETSKRIVFPLRSSNGDIFGVVARAINGEEPKYLTIKFDEQKQKIFGLNRLSRLDHAYVVEGPIDSLFIDNCIAITGTDADLSSVFSNTDHFTLILDNQPRNKEVLYKYQKYMDTGHRMFIWPDNIHEKDINDLVMSGYSRQDIKSLIDKNTYSGIKLKIRFNSWRKL